MTRAHHVRSYHATKSPQIPSVSPELDGYLQLALEYAYNFWHRMQTKHFDAIVVYGTEHLVHLNSSSGS